MDRHQTCRPVKVSCEFNHAGGNFIFLRTSMLILYKNDRKVRFVLFTKTSITKTNMIEEFDRSSGYYENKLHFVALFRTNCQRIYRLGTFNSNTVNSKFHLIPSFLEIFATFLLFHV